MERDEPSAPASLAQSFWTVARRLRHHWLDALAPWDVSPSQLRTLGTLSRHGSARPSTLARELGIVPRSVTEVVDGLEDRGLVARHTDPDDRRATLVAVTGRGREVVAAVHAARATEADRLFDRLDAADRDELRRLLDLLLEVSEDHSVAAADPDGSGAR